MLLIRRYNFAGNYRNSHSPGRGNDDDNPKDHLSESSDFDTPGGVVKKELKRSSKMWEYRSRRRTHNADVEKMKKQRFVETFYWLDHISRNCKITFL